ncbi:uncharacterized protein LOC115276646 [Suricata suricatta]|uniref:uncharacterized protein LOC115276646 n=1 Tax=Suricata suricatta TaxID=37032 RepID=UPI0011559C5A|nr:uncharacterized protein LOC115276646 [Suricata suricatta]
MTVLCHLRLTGSPGEAPERCRRGLRAPGVGRGPGASRTPEGPQPAVQRGPRAGSTPVQDAGQGKEVGAPDQLSSPAAGPGRSPTDSEGQAGKRCSLPSCVLAKALLAGVPRWRKRGAGNPGQGAGEACVL